MRGNDTTPQRHGPVVPEATGALGMRPGAVHRPGAAATTVAIRDNGWMHNEDAMATEKLAEGIRNFYADARKLEQYPQARVTQNVAS